MTQYDAPRTRLEQVLRQRHWSLREFVRRYERESGEDLTSCVNLHHTTGSHPQLTWAEHLETLRPKDNGGFTNAAVPSMTAVQAQGWQALLNGLAHVAKRAAEHNLPLPEPITAWAQWVVPVGRLSFHAGRIVNALDRQRPLAPDV